MKIIQKYDTIGKGAIVGLSANLVAENSTEIIGLIKVVDQDPLGVDTVYIPQKGTGICGFTINIGANKIIGGFGILAGVQDALPKISMAIIGHPVADLNVNVHYKDYIDYWLINQAQGNQYRELVKDALKPGDLVNEKFVSLLAYWEDNPPTRITPGQTSMQFYLKLQRG